MGGGTIFTMLCGEDILVIKVELPLLLLDNALHIIFARNFLAYCVCNMHALSLEVLYVLIVLFQSLHPLMLTDVRWVFGEREIRLDGGSLRGLGKGSS